ncbi:DUF2207 domain-containing protein [Enemella evansiae]|uniref:DUF2207 domain-containing protein n=1 Tax=Enemella evansiae TaxID=2016499 RepID=UPI000B965BBF|nr:DUF2207 domain-containing protein [Enemella evansiae]OYO10324.1 hypothetical protein BI335_17455 [Enemella evansiae]
MNVVIVAVGVLLLLVAVTVAVVAWQRSRDEIFIGPTPGLLPAPGQPVRVERVRPGREYAGAVAVQFQPPRDLAPGLVGTIVDGHAEMRDVTATIIDLAVRGFLRIQSVGAPEAGQQDGRGRGRKAKQDWILEALPNPPADARPFEAALLRGLFRTGPRVRMSDLQAGAGQAMREAQVDLYRQVVANGWYPRHPAASGGKLRIWGTLLLILGLIAGLLTVSLALTLRAEWWALAGPIAAVVGGLVLLLVGRRARVGRTATGTAVAIQARGFKQYLTTAEADQIRFEEASEIFSRYLPYAIVFGVADHWAKVFGEVAKRYQAQLGVAGGYTAGDALFDLMWFDLLTDGDLDLFNLPELFGGLDIGDAGIGDVLSGFTDSVDSFVDSANGFDLPDLGGCDGCDLDLGGCDGCG